MEGKAGDLHWRGELFAGEKNKREEKERVGRESNWKNFRLELRVEKEKDT